jgi:hypothetical protein
LATPRRAPWSGGAQKRRADISKRQHFGGGAALDGGARHAEYGRVRLVLGDRMPVPPTDLEEAFGSIAPHSGQESRDRRDEAPDLNSMSNEGTMARIGRLAHEPAIGRRPARERQMSLRAGSDIDPPPLQRRAIPGLHHFGAARFPQSIGEPRRKIGAYMLSDGNRRAARREGREHFVERFGPACGCPDEDRPNRGAVAGCGPAPGNRRANRLFGAWA